jgi:small-conductance mechanosensitive channel
MRRGSAVGFVIRSCIVAIGLFLPLMFAASVDAATPPPAGMTQQQYDDLVKAVGQSVIQTLTEKGLVTAPPASPPSAKPAPAREEAQLVGRIRNILDSIPTVMGGYPELWGELSLVPERLDQPSTGGRGLGSFLGLLLLSAIAALLVEMGVSRLTCDRRNGIVRQFTAIGGLWRVAAVAFLDALALVALWLLVQVALGSLFARAGFQTEFAGIVLRGLVTWRMFLLLFRLYLRPDLPVMRIAPVPDASARRIFGLFGFVVLVGVFGRAWIDLLTSPAAVSAAILTNGTVELAIFIVVLFMLRADITVWLLGLIRDEGGSKGGIRVALAQHWHWIALPLLIMLGLGRIYDAVSDLFVFPFGAILTVNIILGLLLAETLWAFILRYHRAAMLAASGSTDPGRLLPFLVRAIRATLWVVAAAVLVRTWAVDVLNLVDEQEWSRFSHAWTTTVATALLAYFAWEAVHFATERRRDRPKAGITGPESETGATSVGATRLETLAPILRLMLGIIIIITAALTILESLGVSITPVIAGASIFGLAISFGSQTLVHDIVSGLFYLADDAFRVGEYIDVGKAKGTVEGFTLRSIRMRHQNGQIHTIPFGQLGQITNFSRDWSTLKFNLRLVRDTDLDKLRKVTKKIGQEMLADPEFKNDFLEPLKLQGVAEIADTATVMRFKMTVRPVRPSYVQREAMKRLIAGFKEAGIEFAGAGLVLPPVAAAAPTPVPAMPATR